MRSRNQRSVATWGPRIAFGALAALAACGPDGCCTGPTGDGDGDGKPKDARVRSCDVLIVVDGAEVPSVDFSDEVRGQSIPQAPKLAVSFAAKADEALTTAPFTLRFRGDGSARIDRETCFDKDGKALDGTPVELP